MTSDELAEIEARANAATPGPWECEVRHGAPSIKGGPVHNFARGAGRHQILSVVGQDWMRADEPTCNAKFAAHARTDIPALVAAVRERDAEIAKLKQLVSELTSGKQEVRCLSCGVTIDMGPIVDEVTYVGDTFDLECDKCGCEFTAHAETMTICFDAEVDEVAK